MGILLTRIFFIFETTYSMIHRACAGNDLTSRGFGNYLRDITLLKPG